MEALILTPSVNSELLEESGNSECGQLLGFLAFMDLTVGAEGCRLGEAPTALMALEVLLARVGHLVVLASVCGGE